MPVAKRKGRTGTAARSQAASASRGTGAEAEDAVFDLLNDETSSSSPARSALQNVVSVAAVSLFSWMAWHCLHREAYVQGSPYLLLPGAVSEHVLDQSVALGAQVAASGSTKRTRSFGTGQHYLSQHSIIYLHGPSGDSPALREIVAALRHVAETAARKHGWSLASQPLVPRCIELIKYAGSSSGASNNSESIGWHDDGATLLTVAVALSERGSYDGGKIEVAKPDGTTSVAWPARGDAVVWRGWDRHRVLPIMRGERNVLVGEFWSDRASHAWNTVDDRPLDDIQRYHEALKLDPRSAALHEGLGVLTSKQDHPDAAEESFRQAVMLNPLQASAFTGLGVVLQHEDKLKGAMAALGLGGVRRAGPPRAAEAEDALQRAIQLDPTIAAAPYDLSLLFQRIGRHSEAAAFKETALRLDPDLLSEQRNQQASAASQLHS